MSDTVKPRMTSQRRVILDCLKGAKSHPTAYEVYRMVRKRLPEISLATVYRNLDVLHEAGAVQRLDFAGARMRFDGDMTPHYHARCVRCGRVVDVAASVPLQDADVTCEKCGFRVLSHRLEFLGLCPKCAARPTGGVLRGHGGGGVQ